MSSLGFWNTWVRCKNCNEDFLAYPFNRKEQIFGFERRCWKCRHVSKYTCADLQQSVSLGPAPRALAHRQRRQT